MKVVCIEGTNGATEGKEYNVLSLTFLDEKKRKILRSDAIYIIERDDNGYSAEYFSSRFVMAK